MAKHLRDFYKEIQNTICVIYILALLQHKKGPKLNLFDGVPNGNFKGREVQILHLFRHRLNQLYLKFYLHRKTTIILSQKAEVVDEQMWRGSSRGAVTVCEHTYACIDKDTHTYIYIYRVPLMILRLFIKYCKIQCF